MNIEELKEFTDESGNINLSYKTIDSLPEGLHVKGTLNLFGAKITKLPSGLKVDGVLKLPSENLSSLPDGLVVGGSLFLNDATLNGAKIASLSDDALANGEFLFDESFYLNEAKITSLPDGLVVGGSAYLSRTKITSLPEDLVVGGSLYLPKSIRKLPKGLVVGKSLDLSDTKITSLPGDLVVGGSLYLPPNAFCIPKSIHVRDVIIYISNEIATDVVYPQHKRFQGFQEGDYEPGKYLFADGILTLVRREKVIGDYTYYVGKIPGKNVITDGNNYAHCSSFKEGVIELNFKAAKDRGADQYKGIDPDTEMGVQELMAMYRVITGACQQGTEQFVKSMGELKPKYTIREVIELTEGHYGASTFKKFFQ